MTNDIVVLGAPTSAAAPAPPVSSAYPPEVGILAISGRSYWRMDGSIYNTRGVTAFALPAQMRQGNDIRPQIDWLHSINANRVRVFPDWTTFSAGQRNPDGSWKVPPVQWNGHNQNFDDPNFLPWLADTFLPFMKGEGIRCEVVPVVTYERPVSDMRRILSSCYEICGADRFHFVEDVNEPWNRGIDVPQLTAGLFRHGVLCAYGTQPIPTGEIGWAKPPCVDYITWRSGRDEPHFFRSSKDQQEMWGFGVPLEDDEPCGAAEYMGADPTGGAMRNNRVLDHVGHAAIARLYGGGTLHIQCMFEGRVPGDDEPRQAEIAAAVGEVYAALPDDCYLGGYSRNGLETFPFRLEPTDTPNDPHVTGYASLHGDRAYVVIPRPKHDYVPRLDNGWTSYEKIGPAQGFLYLAKR